MTETISVEQEKSTSSWIGKQNAGLWFGIFFLIFSIIFFVKSFDLPYFSRLGPGPGLYPRWLAGISICVALAYIWQSCTRQKFIAGEVFPGKKELANVASIFVSCMVFLLLLNHIGFLAAGFLLMFITFARQYRLLQTILLSATITGVCYFIFKVCFLVPLP